MNREEFVKAAKQAALESSKKSGLPAGITVAQAVLESNWGQSGLSVAANNYFGLKAHGKHDAMAFKTTEFVQGTKQIVTAKFAAYGSMQECFECRDRQILNGKVYEAARAAKSNPQEFAKAVGAHWATDPKYAEKLLNIYDELKLAEMEAVTVA